MIRKGKITVPLHTDSLAKANALKWDEVAKIKANFEAARKGIPDAGPLMVEAEQLRLQKSVNPEVHGAKLDARIDELGSDPELFDFVEVAAGLSTPLTAYLESFSTHKAYRIKSAADLERVVGWLQVWLKKRGEFAFVEDVGRKLAGQFLEEELLKGRSTKKVQSYLGFLREYWRWLKQRGHASENPWLDQDLPKAPRRTRDAEPDKGKRGYTDDELVKLLGGPATAYLPDLMMVAALSGMRIEEICQLRVSDCAGGKFHVWQGKTSNAVRDVPIHTDLVTLVERRVKGKEADAYIFEELPETPESRDTRSDPASKRFTRYRRSVEVDHHDDWLVPAEEKLQGLADRVFEWIELERPPKSRKRPEAAERRRGMVANVIANLALLSAYRPAGSRLIISARAVPQSRYARDDFPKAAFMDVVSAMERAGLVERERGFYSSRRGQRTTLSPIGPLLDALPNDTPALSRLAGSESVLLRAPSGNKRRGDDRAPKTLVDYLDTADTEWMRAEMLTINAAINAANITLNGKKQPPVNLVRMFQIESPDATPTFDLHGRLYWGFWESLPRADRPLIQIGGQPVAELDFAGMFARLAYAEVGAEPPPGDIYEGLGMPRETAKWAMSSLLCRRSPLRKLPEDRQAELGPHWNGHRVTAALASRHPAIAPLFCKGIGLRLMFTESQIMVATLLALVEQGTVALPIHDGLLIPEDHLALCEQIMEDTARNIAGSRLPVRRKA